MGEAEDVAGLMREHLAAAAQQERLITSGAGFTIKSRIVSGEAVNPNTLAMTPGKGLPL